MQLYTDRCFPQGERTVCNHFVVVTLPHGRPHAVLEALSLCLDGVMLGAYCGQRQSSQNHAACNMSMLPRCSCWCQCIVTQPKQRQAI